MGGDPASPQTREFAAISWPTSTAGRDWLKLGPLLAIRRPEAYSPLLVTA